MPFTKSSLLLTSLPIIPLTITLILFFYPEKSKESEGRKEEQPKGSVVTTKALAHREPKWRIPISDLNLKLNGL